jgi:hypothetical protein
LDAERHHIDSLGAVALKRVFRGAEFDLQSAGVDCVGIVSDVGPIRREFALTRCLGRSVGCANFYRRIK